MTGLYFEAQITELVMMFIEKILMPPMLRMNQTFVDEVNDAHL